MDHSPAAPAKMRDSNFELLRIVSMFLILIVHADFFSIGAPKYDAVRDAPLSSFTRLFVESLALVCVNVYILISGYFRINVKLRSVCNFLFLVIFWRVGVAAAYAVAHAAFGMGQSLTIAQWILFCIPGDGDWFVEAYMLLLLFSPILNAYLDRTTTRQLWAFLAAFFVIQLLLNWSVDALQEFDRGYSFLSFAGLYILGAALRRTDFNFSRFRLSPAAVCMWGYVAVAFVAAAILFAFMHVLPRTPFSAFAVNKFDPYNGPAVLLASALFFLAFRYMKFQSRAVNYIAGSAFAVYLFLMHPLMRDYYARACRYLFNNFGTLEYIALIAAMIIGVFCFAVLVDQLRRVLWDRAVWPLIDRCAHPAK